MKTWKVPVYWQMAGVVDIVADTLVEAMALAGDESNNIPLPVNGTYLEGTWEAETDEGVVRECYNGGMED